MSVVVTNVSRVRLLHTSDWHIGRTIHGADLMPAQHAFFDHLEQLVVEREIDAVLVAGDVFDRAIPGTDAVELLSDVVRRLAQHAEIIITSGNHDSATRLGFMSGLLRENVHIATDIDTVGTPVLLGENVAVYPLPYLHPEIARIAFMTEETDEAALPANPEAVTVAALRRVRADLENRPGVQAVVMAHAFVTGAAPSESERDLTVGGIASVPTAIFDGIDYVALGHVHGQQSLVPDRIRYSGSPIAFSFSEERHSKGTTIVEIGDSTVHTEHVPAPVLRELQTLSGPLDEILGRDDAAEKYVRAIVTDDARPTDMAARLRARFPHVLQIEHRPATIRQTEAPEITQGTDPVEVLEMFVAHITGTPPTDAERDVLAKAYDAVRKQEMSA